MKRWTLLPDENPIEEMMVPSLTLDTMATLRKGSMSKWLSWTFPRILSEKLVYKVLTLVEVSEVWSVALLDLSGAIVLAYGIRHENGTSSWMYSWKTWKNSWPRSILQLTVSSTPYFKDNGASVWKQWGNGAYMISPKHRKKLVIRRKRRANYENQDNPNQWRNVAWYKKCWKVWRHWIQSCLTS